MQRTTFSHFMKDNFLGPSQVVVVVMGTGEGGGVDENLTEVEGRGKGN
jgi:hypothetical protein